MIDRGVDDQDDNRGVNDAKAKSARALIWPCVQARVRLPVLERMRTPYSQKSRPAVSSRRNLTPRVLGRAGTCLEPEWAAANDCAARTRPTRRVYGHSRLVPPATRDEIASSNDTVGRRCVN